MVKGLESMAYENRLSVLGLFGLEETEGSPIANHTFLMRGSGKGDDLFFLVSDDRTQKKDLKLCQGRFRLGIMEKVLYWEGDQALKQAPQESDRGPKTVVQESFGHHMV